MKPYEKYVPSGVEWIGEIPEGWEVKKLKHISQLRNSKTEDSEITYIALEHIESSTGKLLKKEDDDAQPDAECLAFCTGDVLFCKLRPYLAKCILAGFNGKCSSELLVLQSKIKLIPKYLFFVVLSHGFLEMVNSSTYGSKMPRANWDFIGNMWIALPDPDTQTVIANYLDHETVRIDNIIKAKETLIDRLKEKRTALITHAVTKGLDPNAKMKPSGVEWIGDIPVGWEVKKLKFVSSIATGNTPSKNTNDYYDNEGMLWVKPDNLNEFVPISETAEKLSVDGIELARISPARSTLVCCIGTVGKFGYADQIVAYNQQINAVTFSSLVFWKYGLYSLSAQQQQHQYYMNGNVVHILNTSGQKQVKICLPAGMHEQTDIANYLDTETAKIDTTIEKTKLSIEKLKEYRTALISACVTGKIDVRSV